MDLQTWFLKKLGIDKVLHFLAGGWIACFSCGLIFNFTTLKTWIIALMLAFTIGLLKELVDKFIRKSIFCWKDLLATTLGGAVTAACIYFGLI